jgi:hypothetical protein
LAWQLHDTHDDFICCFLIFHIHMASVDAAHTNEEENWGVRKVSPFSLETYGLWRSTKTVATRVARW